MPRCACQSKVGRVIDFPESNKVFCFFFSKKKCFLSLLIREINNLIIQRQLI